MKWFDNWFLKQSEKAWNTAQNKRGVNKNKSFGIGIETPVSVAIPDEPILNNRLLHSIRMQSASGGKVVEVSKYDPQTGEWIRDLYIIRDDQNLTQELSSILVQYELKNG